MNPSANQFRKIGGVALFAMLALAAGGCNGGLHSFNSRHDTTLGKKRQVQNVHQEQTMPSHLGRVAVLPLFQGRYEHIDMEELRENFLQEIIKRNVFEVVAVSPEAMQDMFGQKSYSSVEYLPTRLLAKLHHAYAIDGVMLIDVSFFRAYQPVGLGVRAKLLDGHTGEIVWAVDEMFDAANPAVSNAARKYFQTESVNPYPLQQTQTVLHSPARFSKYVADAVFGTIQ